MGEYVTLTAKVVSNLGLPALSGTVTWYNGSKKIGTSQVDGTGTATMVTDLPDAGDVTLAASYSGDLSGYATLALPVFGYALSANPSGPVTAAAGQSAHFTINVGAFHGFRGQIDLSLRRTAGSRVLQLLDHDCKSVSHNYDSSSHSGSAYPESRGCKGEDSPSRMPGLLFAGLCPPPSSPHTSEARTKGHLGTLMLAIMEASVWALF